MASTPRTVLVTGASGMLGSHIADRLAMRGIRVLALDRVPPIDDDHDQAGTGLITPVVGDITDAAAAGDLVADCDGIVHVAGVLSHEHGSPPGSLFAVNVAATHTLFEAAAEQRVKIVFASSGSVYGPSRPAVDGDPPAPYTECDRAPELGFYGLSKHVNELYARTFGAEFGLSWVALRLGVLYGARLRTGGTSRFLISVLDAAEAGDVPVVEADPDSGLDWVPVADAAECFVRALVSDICGEALNTATGQVTRLAEVLSTLLRLAGHPEKINWGAHNPTGRLSVARSYAPERLYTRLGFRPSDDLNAGLSSYLDWRRRRSR